MLINISGIFCGGTNAGNLIMWKKEDEEWEVENVIPTSAPVKDLSWGYELLVVNTLAGLYVLKQQPLAAHHNQNVTAFQVTGSNVILLTKNLKQKNIQTTISCEMQVHGLSVSSKYCVIWSDKSVVSYTFNIDSEDLFVQPSGIYFFIT